MRFHEEFYKQSLKEVKEKRRGGTPLFIAAPSSQPNGRDNPSVYGRMDRRPKRATQQWNTTTQEQISAQPCEYA